MEDMNALDDVSGSSTALVVHRQSKRTKVDTATPTSSRLFQIQPRQDCDGDLFLEKAPGILDYNWNRTGAGRTGGCLEAYVLIKQSDPLLNPAPFALVQWAKPLDTSDMTKVSKKHSELFSRPRRDDEPMTPVKPKIVNITTAVSSEFHVACYRRKIGDMAYEFVGAPRGSPHVVLRGWENSSEVFMACSNVAAQQLLEQRPECIALLCGPTGQDARSLERLQVAPEAELALANDAMKYAADQDELTEELKQETLQQTQQQTESDVLLLEMTCEGDDKEVDNKKQVEALHRALGGKVAFAKLQAALVENGSSSAVLGHFYELLCENAQLRARISKENPKEKAMGGKLYTRNQRKVMGTLVDAGVTDENWRVWDAAKLLGDRATTLFAGMVRLPTRQPGSVLAHEPRPCLTLPHPACT